MMFCCFCSISTNAQIYNSKDSTFILKSFIVQDLSVKSIERDWYYKKYNQQKALIDSLIFSIGIQNKIIHNYRIKSQLQKEKQKELKKTIQEYARINRRLKRKRFFTHIKSNIYKYTTIVSSISALVQFLILINRR